METRCGSDAVHIQDGTVLLLTTALRQLAYEDAPDTGFPDIKSQGWRHEMVSSRAIQVRPFAGCLLLISACLNMPLVAGEVEVVAIEGGASDFSPAGRCRKSTARN